MEEMQQHPYDSADWQGRWDQVITTLTQLAAEPR